MSAPADAGADRRADPVEPASTSGPMGGQRYLAIAAAIILAGLLIRMPAVFSGFAADDYAQMAMVDGTFPVERSAFELFTFTTGDPEEVRHLREVGYLPWWAADDLKLSVMRPLSSALMWLDRRAFGNDPLPYHLHSLGWWLALCFAVAYLFRELLPPRIALWALAVYVGDGSHTAVLGWLANRNSGLASLFAVLSLRAFLAFHKSGSGRSAASCAAWFSLSLACGEYALTFLGYFGAWVLLDMQATPGARVRRLMPVLIPTAIFLGLRGIAGIGARGSGAYFDPADTPGDYLLALVQRAPALWADAFGGPPADYWNFGLPGARWLHEQGLVSRDWIYHPAPYRDILLVLGVLALGMFAIAAKLGSRRLGGGDRAVACMALGAVLAAIPLSAAPPSGRNVLAIHLGVAVVVAAFLSYARHFIPIQQFGRAIFSRIGVFAMAAWLGLAHLVVDPARSLQTAWVLGLYSDLSRRAALSLSKIDGDLTTKRIYIAQSTDPNMMMYTSIIRRQYGHDVPRSVHTLDATTYPLVIRREGPRTLLVGHLFDGTMLSGSFEQLFRSDNRPFRVGQIVTLEAMQMEIMELKRGRPSLVRFTFDTDLDDPSMVFLQQRWLALVPMAIPKVGHNTVISNRNP